MNEEQLKLADLSNVKVGDTIWTIHNGFTEVKEIRLSDIYSIKTKIYSYTFDGKNQKLDKHPSAFTKNPFENVGFQERWLMVSNDKLKWRRRRVFMRKNKIFFAWDRAETNEEADEEMIIVKWSHVMELEEPKELTLEERIERLEKLI